MAEPIRVLIVDDHAVVREGLRAVLDGHSDFTVVAEADTGAGALTSIGEHQPDIAVLDVSLPDRSGLDVAQTIRQRFPGTRVLILSVYDDAEYVRRAVQVGAGGYLLKDSSPQELREAIRAVHRGASVFGAPVAQHLSTALADGQPRSDHAAALDQLTPREREVLRLIATGLTNKEAGARLGISPRTVETHRENVLRKLGVRSVAELTKLAIRAGVIRG